MTKGIMGRSTTIIVVVAAVCLVAVAPAVALTPDGTLDGGQQDGDDGGTTLLPGSNSSTTDDGSSDSDSDSTDDGTSTDDSSDENSGDTSGDTEESSESTSNDSSETDGTDSTEAGSTDDSTAESQDDRVLTAVSESTNGTTTGSDSFVDTTIRSTEAVEILKSAIDATNDSSDLEETANETVSETTDTVSETTDTVEDLESTTDSVVGTLRSETRLTESTTATGAPRVAEQVGSSAATSGSARQSFVAPSTNLPGPGADVSPGPATGVALGVGVVALGAVTRQGTAMSGALAGLGSTLSAGLAPVVGGSNVLGRLIRAIAPFRYSRYDDSDPLEHEARSDVFEIVKSTPGAYLSEVAKRAELPLSTARHHVRVLEREDLLSGAKVRGKRRFYPAYTNGVELAAAMNDDATAAVLDAIARLGAASVSDLADDLGRDPSTISHHLQRLEEDGIIVRERDGRAVMNKLAPEARTALAPESGEAEVAEAGEALASD